MRTLARTDKSMPMKPAAPDKTDPMRNPIADHGPNRGTTSTKIAAPTMAMVVY